MIKFKRPWLAWPALVIMAPIMAVAFILVVLPTLLLFAAIKLAEKVLPNFMSKKIDIEGFIFAEKRKEV